MRRRVRTLPDEKCPYCGWKATVSVEEDDDGEFVLKSCSNCAWVKIEDPHNPLLAGEARPPNGGKNAC